MAGEVVDNLSGSLSLHVLRDAVSQVHQVALDVAVNWGGFS
jgi:hypothetical protein